MANKIMKSTLASVLAIMSVAASVPGTAIGNVFVNTAVTASAEAVSGDFTYEELSDGTVCITKYNGTSESVNIPGQIDGKTVSKIGDKAFIGNKNITKVLYSGRGDALTEIGEFAFCNCTALEDVFLPNTVKTIGRGAFASCTSLSDINLPYELEAIEEGTFQRCASLTYIEIPETVKYIGDSAFLECTKLHDVFLDMKSENVSIGNKAFYKCEDLEGVSLSLNVVEVGDYAFFGCTNLKGVFFEKDYYNSPQDCKPITIGDSAFGSCTSLTDLELSDQITSIGNDAFANCKSLESVSLPGYLKTLGKRAFTNCHALINVSLGGRLETIPMGAFATTGITDISFSESVTNIDSTAFYGCKSLTEVIFPASIKTIGTKAFESCPVQKVTFSGTDYQWSKVEIAEGNDVLLNAAKNFNSKPNNPIIYSSYETTDSTITLGWTSVTGSDKYAVAGYQNGRWVILTETTDTSYVIKNLKPNTEYKIAVFVMVNGEWNKDIYNLTNYIKPKTKAASTTSKYPTISNIIYNEQYHQFRVTWTPVEGAQAYGIAYYAAGKWRVATQTIPASTTTFTSPKLTAGSTHKCVIAAKVNGKWDTSNLNSRAFTVTVK